MNYFYKVSQLEKYLIQYSRGNEVTCTVKTLSSLQYFFKIKIGGKSGVMNKLFLSLAIMTKLLYELFPFDEYKIIYIHMYIYIRQTFSNI